MSLPIQSTTFRGNWSYSKLDVFETCKYRYQLQFIEKLPQKEQPPENPMVRGNRVHKRLEDFVKGEGPMDTEARAIKEFHKPLEHLQTLYFDGKATAEQDWLFNEDWDVCDRNSVWLWSKLDVNVIDIDNGISIPIDYKTGGSKYKALNHHQQMQLYAAITALRQEWAQRIIVELWYLDEGHIKSHEYTREEALRFVGRFDKRAKAIYAQRLFEANPNRETCRYCPYGKSNGTGACAVSA
jgi:CRISPR/Cas system-associated exonuclease Cas4 (RecB family)